jgi:hypothetical protein
MNLNFYIIIFMSSDSEAEDIIGPQLQTDKAGPQTKVE